MSTPKADWKPGAAFLSYLAIVIGAGLSSGWIVALTLGGALGLAIVTVLAIAQALKNE